MDAEGDEVEEEEKMDEDPVEERSEEQDADQAEPSEEPANEPDEPNAALDGTSVDGSKDAPAKEAEKSEDVEMKENAEPSAVNDEASKNELAGEENPEQKNNENGDISVSANPVKSSSKIGIIISFLLN